MATLKSFKGFIPMELGLGRHYINGFEYVDDNEQSYYVATDNAKAYLISSNIINYYPETCFPKVKRIVLDPVQFGMTLDEVVDLTEAEITQHQITNYFSDTLAEAKALTYKKQERVKIFELDEVYECVEILPTPIGYASSTPIEIAGDLYFLSFDANSFGQLYKKTAAGATTVVNAFAQNGNGTKPIGNLITDSTFIYIETSQGGANGLGTLVKYNVSTGTVSKVIDFSSTLGFSNSSTGARFEELRSQDKVIISNKLYMATSSGGANGVGTIIVVDLALNTATKILDITTTPSYTSGVFNVACGVGVEHNGDYVVAVNNDIHRVNTTTNAVTTVSLPTVRDYARVSSGFKEGNFLYLNFATNTSFAVYDLSTDTITQNASLAATLSSYVSWKQGNFIYALLQAPAGDIYKFDITTGAIVQANADHPNLTGFSSSSNRPFNSSFNTSTGILYFTDGGLGGTQKNINKYNVSTGQLEVVYNLQSTTGSANTDDQYTIEIDQSATANLYLRVRDNHTKTVVLDSNSLGLDVTTTRGVTTNIPFPTGASGDFYSFQYATNTSAGNAFDIKAAQGNKTITDNLTLISKTVAGNPFNGSKLVLAEGIYKIQVNTSIAPQVSNNTIQLIAKDAVANTELSKASFDTNKIFTTRFDTMLDAIVVDSTVATNGIEIAFNGISSTGSFLNIFDIRIHITKIGDNI